MKFNLFDEKAAPIDKNRIKSSEYFAWWQEKELTALKVYYGSEYKITAKKAANNN